MTELEKLEKELLQEIQEEPGIYENAEEFCTIEPETRTITVPLSKRILGTESDQETNRLYFKCPKVVGDNVDLSLFSLRINYQNAGNKKDQYLVEDVKEEGDTITFSWLLKRSVTAYKGNVKFILCAVKTTEDGAIKNEWNTTLNTECESLEGMEVDQTAVEEETKDIVEQLIAMMNQSAENAVHAVETAKTEAIKVVQTEGTTQAGNVSAEGEKQVQAVRGAAQEIIADREQIQENKTGIAKLKEDIVELTPIIGDEYEAYDISYEFNKMGFINNNGNITHSSTSRYTEHIPVRANDMFYYKLVEDNKNSYGIAIYDNDKNFIKGYKISTPETTYRIIKGSFVVTEGSFIKFSSLNATDENLAPLLYVKKNKSNEHSFKKYKEVYGDVEYKFLDISNDLHEIRDKYLNVSGDAIDYPNQNSFVTDYYDVKEGEIYKYVTRALHKNPSYVVYDKHRRLIDKGGTISGINTGDIVIPPMGAYIRFNKMSDTSNVFKVSKKIPKPLAEVIDDKITVKSMDIPAKHTELQVNIMNGFLNESNIISGDTEDSEYVHTDYINISEYKWFNTHVHYGWAAVGYLLLDENKIVLYALKSSTGKDEKIILQTKDILSKYPKAKYIRFVGEKIGKKSLKVFVNHKTTDYDLALETVISKSNMLYNKKIAFCGDSFTEASNLGDNYYDAYYGCYKSYGWRIADRNGMRLYHDGISGSTMHVVDIATPTKSNPFAYERYKKIPKDCDYIILQFGLNEFSIVDSPDTKGTKESVDTSTMWGAWNVVLEYLITNHPKARIGVIMSDAWMPQSYYETLKEICEWWGIPLLDLGGDANIPVMNSGRRVGCGLTLNPKVTELRNREFYQNFESGDAHPNDVGHEWRSTVIEDFIRRL